jgi:hypothetical protein
MGKDGKCDMEQTLAGCTPSQFFFCYKQTTPKLSGLKEFIVSIIHSSVVYRMHMILSNYTTSVILLLQLKSTKILPSEAIIKLEIFNANKLTNPST